MSLILESNSHFNKSYFKWIILSVISLIWGSSFILIKKSLIAFTPIQSAVLRIGIAGLVLFFIYFRHLRLIRWRDYPWLVLSALTGIVLPVFLFAYAETELESGIAAILNTLVPMFTLIIAFLFFKQKASFIQVFGIVLGFVGAVSIILAQADFSISSLLHPFLVILATFFYAVSFNLIKWRLSHISSLQIVSFSFSLFVIPCFVVLLCMNFFQEITFSSDQVKGFFYIGVLSILGSALAFILFYQLIKISSLAFSSSVAYLMPIIAVFWGVFDGEYFVFSQALSGLLIFFGVYLTRR